MMRARVRNIVGIALACVVQSGGVAFAQSSGTQGGGTTVRVVEGEPARDARGSAVSARYSDPGVLPDPDGYARPRAQAKLKMPKFKDPKEEALQEVLDEEATFTREDVERYAEKLDAFKRSVKRPAVQMHKDVFSTVTVNLQPGAVMPVMRLNVNANSAILFMDSTGNPWPIVKLSTPSKNFFVTEHFPNNNAHEVGIEPIKDYAYGNLKVFLAGLSTPVFVKLVTGQRETDVRLDVRVPQRGPNAAPVLQKTLSPEAGSVMYSMLNGVVPDKAVELTVEGGEGRAWSLDDKTYLRVSNKTMVRSPGSTGQMSSLDGTRVYELPARTSIVYAVREGESMELKVSGF